MNDSSPKNIPAWFDPRWKHPGGWAFILNRVTAIGLVVYLAMHLAVLGQLADGPDAYDRFLRFIEHPFFKLGELLVIAGGLIHGLNGIRITLTTFGIAVRWQRQLFALVMLLSLAGMVIFGYKLFFGSQALP